MHDIMRSAASTLALWTLATAAPAFARDDLHLPQGARYVALGSSFASGSGVAPYDPQAPARCQRSTENYAHQLARKHRLNLVDVTCGGATTAHILGPWGELAPQIDALTADTGLVTITIGGNDVGYIGGLIASSCGSSFTGATSQPLCQRILAGRRNGATMPPAAEDSWNKAEAAFASVLQEVRRRSPRARIVVVDYLTVVPDGAACTLVPLSPEVAASGRATAARLARLTSEVASRNGAEVLPASRLSQKAHHACAARPWVTGFIPPNTTQPFSPYHPNRAGMTAIAHALSRHLKRARPR